MLPKPLLANNHPVPRDALPHLTSTDRGLGLIGVSVRAAVEALGPMCVSLVRDVYCDWDTEAALPNRCQTFSLTAPSTALVGIKPATMDWLPMGGFDLAPEGLAMLQKAPHRRLGFSLEAIRFSKSIERWSHRLQQAGLAIPKFTTATQCPPGRWHLKQNWPESPNPWFWQQHVEGELGSAIFLAQDTGVELIGCSHLFVRADWLYQGNVANPIWPSAPVRQSLREIAQILAQDLHPRGLFGIDFVLGEQLWPLEINPRPTASVEVLAGLWHRNLYQEHLHACHAQRTEATTRDTAPASTAQASTDHSFTVADSRELSCDRIFAKYIVYNSDCELDITAERFSRLVQCHSFQSISDRESHLPTGRFRIADLPHPDTKIPPHQPVCTILYQSRVGPGTREFSASEIWQGLNSLAHTLFS
jgi:hypothetical protein